MKYFQESLDDPPLQITPQVCAFPSARKLASVRRTPAIYRKNVARTEGAFRGCEVTVPLRKPPKYEVMLPQIVEMAEAGAVVDLISRALGIGAEVVRDAMRLHRTGQRPPGRVDGRRRQRWKPGRPFVPKCQQITPEVDRRRKAGEGFDRLAREMKVSRPTVVRAYDFANRNEAAAAAREGRPPKRPPYRWSAESRAAKRTPRDA